MKAKTAKKALALFLAVAMVVTLTPSLAMATSDSGANETPKATEEVVEKAEPVDPEDALDVEAQEVDDAVQAASEDGVKAASEDSVKAASDETKVKAAAEETYTVKVQIGEALTDVRLTLTVADSNGNPVGESFGTTANSVDEWGYVYISNIPRNLYVIKVTGTDSQGVNVKGSSYLPALYFNENQLDNGMVKGSVSSFIKDTNDFVTARVDVQNPYPANNDMYYSFTPENIVGYLQGPDKTKYPLSVGNDGYLNATVPANQAYVLAILKIEDYGRIDGGTVDRTVKYTLLQGIGWNIPDTYFSDTNPLPISVKIPTNFIKVEHFDAEKYNFRINVTDRENNNAAAANVTVKVTDPDGKEYTKTTDSQGAADFQVTIPDKRQGVNASYTASVETTDGRVASTSFAFQDMEEAYSTPATASEMFTRSINLPIISSFYADREIYANGEKIYSVSTDEAFEKNDGKESNISAHLSFDGIAKCTGVEAFDSNNNPVDVSLYNSTAVNTGYAVISKENKAKIKDGERIVVKYYYEYTDKAVDYNINITHKFVDSTGAVVHTEKTSATSIADIRVNADSNPDVDMLRTYGENWVQIDDVPGYRNGAGAWFLSTTELRGGNLSPLYGTVKSTSTPKNPVSFVMPHTDVEIILTYVFSDTYLEYDANADDAIGSMYIDWARKGEVKTTKPINDSEEEFEEPQEEYQGEIQSQSVQTAAAASVGNGYQRPGYRFTGWNTKPNGSGTPYYPGQSITITQSTTLYAQWTPTANNPLGGNTYYSLFYKFKSGTAGKSLPAKVANLKSDKKPGLRPADEIDKYVAGSTVSPVGPAVGTEVKVKGGKWIFKGYDKSQIAYTNNVATQADYTFTGTWVYEADSNGSGSGSGDGTGTGDSAQLGIFLALMALTAVAGAAAVFARRRTN